MKVNELIDVINSNDFYCLCETWEKVNWRGVKRVERGLNLDEHRWYSTAIDVYECEDGYVGVFGVYQIFSEQMGCRDIEIRCHAEEYKAVQCITYVPKYEN